MNTTRRSLSAWAGAIVGAALVLSGCGGSHGKAAAGSTPRDGGTLIVGQYQEVTQFDPNRQYSWETWRIDRNIYETLVDEDLSSPTGVPRIVPKLATAWKVTNDARTYTFTLRQGVKFTDGTPFDAEAVRFNVRRFTDPTFTYYDKVSAATMSLVYGDLASFKVIDDHTVEYDFKHPFLDFLRQIPNSGNAASGFFSPAALRKYGQDGLADHPVGTGPFTFQERVRGDHTTLVRNPGYWGPRPHLDKVIFKPIGDDQSRVAALRSGAVDLISRVPPDSVATLQKTAADQARFAKYAGKVEVLADDAKAPEGAAVLLLTWNGAQVSATLQRGKREKELGPVSRTPLANHPDYAQMRQELDRGSREERSDAELRARTQMNLYESLRLVQRHQTKG